MKKDLISMRDMDRAEIERYLNLAAHVERLSAEDKRGILPGRILMVMFYEPSTRTRLSFESAMSRLGGKSYGFAETVATSVAKGESLRDTVSTVENYADILVIRHPSEGSARLAAEVSRLPVINAGDGSNQHPTQTLLDLYTIRKTIHRLSGFRIALVGDLKYSRTIHSLVQALMKFGDVSFTLTAPETLKMPRDILTDQEQNGCTFTDDADLADALQNNDIVYMTRVQRERFPDLLEYEKVKDAYYLHAGMLENAPPGLKILHPLPRVTEIASDVDQTRHAGYFDQVRNGLVMRQAILWYLLEGVAV